MLCILRLQTVKQPQSSASHRMFPQVFMRENDGGPMGIRLLTRGGAQMRAVRCIAGVCAFVRGAAAAALGISPSFTAACLLS